MLRVSPYTFFCVFLSLTLVASAVEQVIQLKAGWNAIWIELEPRLSNSALEDQEPRPEEVFTDPAIVEVAMPYGQASLGNLAFESSNLANSLQSAAWAIWKRNAVVTSNTLVRVLGNKPYLVKVDGATSVTLNLSGEAKFYRPDWQADAYNLLGFGVDQVSPPTFRDFFRYSDNKHSFSTIYELNTDGAWSLVNPLDSMESGKAYWIYSDGASDYMGPISVSFPNDSLGELDLGVDQNLIELVNSAGVAGYYTLSPLTFKSHYTSATVPTIERVTAGVETVTDELKVYRVLPDPSDELYSLGSFLDASYTVLDNGESPMVEDETRSIFLGGIRDWVDGGVERTNVYKVVTTISGKKSYVYLPVVAEKAGALEVASDITFSPTLTGLWVGEVLVNEVSSLVNEGSPIQPTATPAPLKIIVHIDAQGEVKLLSSVTWMQEYTADEADTAEQVLVINNDKIPYYEGIEQRNGKVVGRRIESSSYDMPRMNSATAQSALYVVVEAAMDDNGSLWTEGRTSLKAELEAAIASGDAGAVELVKEKAILSYLAWVSKAPTLNDESILEEDYHFSWPLEGTFDPGNTVKTADGAPLVLDPFHRSNPYRHTFHPAHGKGANIERQIAFQLDSKQASYLELTGSYTEILSGLTSGDLEVRGALRIVKVADVLTLVD